ncbi:YqaJ viral recombinase family protein [Zymobacter sp. IVIA_5232.4 C2]|uniref:YqaJ viral recombinase family protein n=1 Tax=Zymobacter sp. IVIA_5232.4 C2 TaxID=3394855 RepID=UPI0039C18793
MFKDARKRLSSGPRKGQFTDRSVNYAFRVAVERISGMPLDDGFETYAMRRGHEMEPDARMEHELQSGLIVEETGFVTDDEGIFGASADGLIGDDGGAEYKCFTSPEKLKGFWIDGDVSDVIDQVQGCMWITGRKWWHIGMYCPALEPAGKQLWWQSFGRNDDYIAELEKDMKEFCQMVDSFEQKLRSSAA